MLMSLGKIIYFNEARLAVNYFSSLNFVCPKLSNPADYFMHMMSVEDTRKVNTSEKSTVALSKEMIMEEQKVKILEFHIQYEKSDLRNDYSYMSPDVKPLSDNDMEENFVPWTY